MQVRSYSYIGLFFVTMATLMYQVILTRIFSVTMWYHFAFVAISIALFGMALGAIIVYLKPNYFRFELTKYHLSLFSSYFALTIVLSFLTHLSIPFSISSNFVSFFSIFLNYVVIAIPFTFSGIVVALALTRFPKVVNKLYASDLIGASFGCLLLFLLLTFFDGISSIFIIASIAGIGAIFFAIELKRKKIIEFAFITLIFFISIGLLNSWLAYHQKPFIRLMWVKGTFEEKPLWEKWNTYSRIRVIGDSTKEETPFGWGFSSKLPDTIKTKQLKLDIDASAASYLTNFDGELSKIEFLKYDVTNVAHYLRQNGKILIVGSGGGRDILSALYFKQKDITAVEINKDIIKALTERFSKFTGNLHKYQNVEIINDEARAYINTTNKKFDIIQISLIDTWAATAQGAFVLSENSLYTVEAFQQFLNKLSDDGILTISRWYFREKTGEIYRLVSLANESLKSINISNPKSNILLIRNDIDAIDVEHPPGIGTILIKKKPFNSQEINHISKICDSLNFKIALSPAFSEDTVFTKILSENSQDFFTSFPIRIDAPTDDRPFFFFVAKINDFLNIKKLFNEKLSINMKAVLILYILLIIVFGLSILSLILPLFLTYNKVRLKGSSYFFIYFASIGFGFMLIEISQIQKLTIFLGHPVYGLVVLLFTLLVSSGIGSYFSKFIIKNKNNIKIIFSFALLLIILIIFGLTTQALINRFINYPTNIRIIISMLTIAPIGFVMGLAFPIGLKLSTKKHSQLTQWFWGINGACSVCSSVLATILSLDRGISFTYWTGVAFYIIAFFSLLNIIYRIAFSKKEQINL